MPGTSVNTLTAYRDGSVYRFTLDRELRSERSLARHAGEVTVDPADDNGCTIVVPIPQGHSAEELVLVHSVSCETPVFVSEVARRDDAFVVTVNRLKGYRFGAESTVTLSYTLVERSAC